MVVGEHYSQRVFVQKGLYFVVRDRLPMSRADFRSRFMGRGKGGGDDWGAFFLILLGIGVGAVALYYTNAGRGEENNAALLPDDLEGRIDFVVTALNKKFGKEWVNFGFDVFASYLQKTLPPEVVALVNVISRVEQLSKSTRMDSHTKQQSAVDWVRRGI